MKKVDIYILGGFLGSGKTTLLGNIIKQEQTDERKIAVLLNELGKVSLDSYFVEEGIPLKELYGGCICCTLQDKLEAQLFELLKGSSLDAIYIETTGAAHPVEVLDAIMSPLLAEKLNYKGIVTVVDLLRWSSRDTFSPQVRHLLYEQVYHADLLLLNKTDLVAELAAAQMVYEIQAINRKASVLLTQNARVSLKQLNQMHIQNRDRVPANAGSQLKLTAMVYEFTKPINQTSFERWLRNLPETVYRIKGFLPLEDSKNPVLFQYSYGMPIYLHQDMKMPLNLVIIGEGLETEEIIKELNTLENSGNV